MVGSSNLKYELDCASWSSYLNFSDIYTHAYTDIENVKVAILLDIPQWQDITWCIVKEAKADGCKVTYEVTRPEYCVVIDGVGGIISIKGNGHIVGELIFFEKGIVPQQKISANGKHFTLLFLFYYLESHWC